MKVIKILALKREDFYENVDMGASYFILIKKNKGMIPIIDNFTLHFYSNRKNYRKDNFLSLSG